MLRTKTSENHSFQKVNNCKLLKNGMQGESAQHLAGGATST